MKVYILTQVSHKSLPVTSMVGAYSSLEFAHKSVGGKIIPLSSKQWGITTDTAEYTVTEFEVQS